MKLSKMKYYKGRSGLAAAMAEIEKEREIRELSPYFRYHPFNVLYTASMQNHIAAGGTVASWCRFSGVGRSTFYAWLKRHPEFRTAFESARATAKDVWRQRCVTRPDDRPNHSWYRFQMANIYGQESLPAKIPYSELP